MVDFQSAKGGLQWTNQHATYLSLDIEGDAKEQWAIEAHFQGVIPVLGVQHGLWRDRDTQNDCQRESDTECFPPQGLQSSCETLDSTIVQPNSCFQKQTQAYNTVSVIQSSHSS